MNQFLQAISLLLAFIFKEKDASRIQSNMVRLDALLLRVVGEDQLHLLDVLALKLLLGLSKVE